jgi:hypothetical protein
LANRPKSPQTAPIGLLGLQRRCMTIMLYIMAMGHYVTIFDQNENQLSHSQLYEKQALFLSESAQESL